MDERLFLVFLRMLNMTFYLLDLTVFVIQRLLLIVQSPFAVHVLVYNRVLHTIFRLVRFVILIGMFIIWLLKLVSPII